MTIKELTTEEQEKYTEHIKVNLPAKADDEKTGAGEGHILARYKQAEKLTGDIYIEAHFYAPKLNDLDYTNTLVMYPYER